MDEDPEYEYCTSSAYTVGAGEEITLAPPNAPVIAKSVRLVFDEGVIAQVADVKINHKDLDGFTCIKEMSGECSNSEDKLFSNEVTFMTVSECAQVCMNNKACSGFIYAFNATDTLKNKCQTYKTCEHDLTKSPNHQGWFPIAGCSAGKGRWIEAYSQNTKSDQ